LAGWGVIGRDTATHFRLYQDTHLGGEGCHRKKYSHTFRTVPGYTPWLGGVSQAEIQLHISDYSIPGYTPWRGGVSQAKIQLHSSDCTRIHSFAGWGVIGRNTATQFRLYQDTHLGWEGCHRQRYSCTV
jgi:hypothetical protein